PRGGPAQPHLRRGRPLPPPHRRRHHRRQDVLRGWSDGGALRPGPRGHARPGQVGPLRRAVPGARRLPVRPGSGTPRVVPADPQRPLGRPGGRSVSRWRPQRNWGARLHEIVVHGLRAVVLENERLRVTLLADKGTDLVELNDKRRDLDYVWLAPNGVRAAPDLAGGAP